MIRIDGVLNGGEEGQLRANEDSIGWKSYSGRMLVHQAALVKKAEWFEGGFRILLVDEEAVEGQQSQVLAFEGLPLDRFDDIWRYFEETCSVYVKRHRPVAALAEADFDRAMRMIEDAADRVDEVPAGSVQKKAREADLMVKVEAVRDGLDQAVGGDKQALSRVFAANGCERIGRLRLVVDTVQVEVYRHDPRWLHLLDKATTIEAVLKELGTYREWRPSENQEHASLARRQMVSELRRQQAGESTEDGDSASQMACPDHQPGQAGIDPHWEQVFRQRQAAAAATMPATFAEGAAAEASFAESRHPTAADDSTAVLAPSSAADRPVVIGPIPHRPLISSDDASNDGELDEQQRARGVKDGDRQSHPPFDAARRLRYMRSDSLLEGWVWKRSRFLKRWRRRWFVLMPGYLVSFKDRGASDVTEFINKGEVLCVYSADNEVNQRRCFCIAVQKRNYYVVCDDDAQKQDWIQAIAKSLGTKYV